MCNPELTILVDLLIYVIIIIETIFPSTFHVIKSHALSMLIREKTFLAEIEPGNEILSSGLDVFDLIALGIGKTFTCWLEKWEKRLLVLH